MNARSAIKVIDVKYIKSICRRLKCITNLTERELVRLFRDDIYNLELCYKMIYAEQDNASLRLRHVIEKNIYLMGSKNNIDEVLNIINTYRCYLSSIKCENLSLIMLFFKYIDRKTYNKYYKYCGVLKTLNNNNPENRRFILHYLLLKSKSCENILLNSLDITKEDAENLKVLMDNKNRVVTSKSYIMARMIIMIEGYLKISASVVYDDDSLKNLRIQKRKLNKLCSDFNCFDAFDGMYKRKVQYFYNSYVSEYDVKRANRYNFSCNIVQNTVMIVSKVDRWYVEVNKINRTASLYHGNDGSVNAYHFQRNFKHADMKRILKYIHSHDLYSLRRFDKAMYKSKILFN